MRVELMGALAFFLLGAYMPLRRIDIISVACEKVGVRYDGETQGSNIMQLGGDVVARLRDDGDVGAVQQRSRACSSQQVISGRDLALTA
ncbi:hypothetical protein BD414DRAFT_502059 [Trametes punicea]|nr:hypothetical protein BD414DRAFT_502059 [Trametes punicea]